jgi:hypothetical protein
MTGDTFEKVKKGVKDAAEKITGSDEEKEEEKKEFSEPGGKEPMNPEDIAGHEPTAVKRDEDTDIAEGGQTGTDSPEAREKYRKKGMTDTK